MVTISYGQGYMHDGDSLTDWAEVQDGNTGTTTVDHGDYLNLNVTVAGVGNDEYYWDNDNPIGISTTTYPTIRWRYKTDGGSIKAKIIAVFSVGEQEVLADSSSSNFTVGSATLTSGKTLNTIELHADHATGDVYYDFIQVVKGDFTFPNNAHDIRTVPPNTNVFLPVPMRHTHITQDLGSGNLEYRIGCDMTTGTWTRTGDTINGQVFYDIVGNANTELWQWFDSEREQMKVTMESPIFTRASTRMGQTDRVDLVLREYRLSDGDNALEDYIRRWGLDL